MNLRMAAAAIITLDLVILLFYAGQMRRIENCQQTPVEPPVAVSMAEKNIHIPGDDVPAAEPEIAEDYENEMIEAALIEKATLIEDCTVTWYTNGTCGKKPGDPAYGITASGLPTVENLTCAVDKRVIPMYSDVFVEFSDGTIRQYHATDTGVKGNHVDIFEPDYDTCMQNGRQTLRVWWLHE